MKKIKKRNAIFLAFLVTTLLFSSSCFDDKKDQKDDQFKASGAIPEFFPEGGFYKTPKEIIIDSNMENVSIYYTTDGSKPTTESPLYTEKIKLDKTTLIRALAVSGSEKHYAMTTYDFDLSEDLKSFKKSPIWQDQVIYFAMMDRFANGDSSNNKQGASVVEDSPEKNSNYSGGDFQGLINKIEDGYFTDLGITTIWITPPVKNQWYEGNHGGYHGYWASNFTEIDPHLGDISKYKEFVEKAHEKGLYVVQDIVVNHVGDYFSITGNSPYLYGNDNWKLNNNSLPLTNPVALPWSLNDPSIFTEEELLYNSFYHWYPAITNFNDVTQLYDYQLSDLDDLNTDNPIVENLLRGYFRFWIDKVDIDGYRVDTVKYVKASFFEKFVNSTEKDNMGIREYAKAKGKKDFILFGEAWDNDDKFVASYTQSENGKQRMDSMIYFPLANSIRSVFGNGSATSEISDILNKRYSSGYANPDKLVTFIDNHDMTRFKSLTNSNMTKAAYAFIMTIPGIPQIYYGSEQEFTTTRRSMFKGGYQGENMPVNDNDYYNKDSDMFLFLKKIISLRKNNSVFRNGKVKIIKDNKNSNGLLCYKLTEGDGGINKEALVIFNTSSKKLAASKMPTFLEEGSILTKQNPSSDSLKNKLTIEKDEILSIVMPGESYGIYLYTEKGTVPPIASNIPKITSSFSEDIITSSITLNGSLTSVPADLMLFFDGKIDESMTLSLNSGDPVNWSKVISLEPIANGSHEITAAIDNGDGTYVFSNSIDLTIARPFVTRATITDAEGDDTGPSGYNYTIPGDESFALHQQDIKNVEVQTAGPDIKINITMKATSNSWCPTVNNFDHVVFAIFLQKSSSTSSVKAFPFYNYNIPFEWDYFIKEDGWNANMFNNNGASANNNGESISPAPSSIVDHDSNIITFDINGDSIGSPTSLDGWKIYIATWDNDSGNPRELIPGIDNWKFGGGNGENGDPLVIDEISPVTISLP